MQKSRKVKLLASVSAAAVLGLLWITHPYHPPFPDLVAEKSKAVVYIVAGHGPTEESHGMPGAAIGSGFFADPSGLIVTNAHVVAGLDAPDHLKFRTVGSTKFWDATVVSFDGLADVATLRVDSWQTFKHEVDYRVLSFAPSSELRPGDDVWAVGHPSELAWTLTRGYLSGNGRKTFEPASPIYYMQTDLRISPGNSGGPLFNMSGRVVGINNAIQGVVGGEISYAIPSEIVQKVIRNYQADPKKGPIWPRLGMSFQPAEDGVGMEIAGLLPKSPLDGKVKVGEKVLEFSSKYTNPTKIVEDTDLPNHVNILDPGDSVTLKVRSKDGHDRYVIVKLSDGRSSAVAEAEVIDAHSHYNRD